MAKEVLCWQDGELVRWQTKEVACLGVASPGAAKHLAIGSSGSVKASSPDVLQIASFSIKTHVQVGEMQMPCLMVHPR